MDAVVCQKCGVVHVKSINSGKCPVCQKFTSTRDFE
jgi:rubrerythrin